MKIAVAQLCVSQDKTENLIKAQNYTTRAKAAGADMIVFPEGFMAYIPKSASISHAKIAEPVEGSFVQALAALAKVNDIYIVCGIYEKKEEELNRAYNTIVVLNRQGQLIHRYRKTHLYDAFSFQESKNIIPGDEPFVPIETEFGLIGVLVCYELRFPEISRILTVLGAEILIVPTAWVAGLMKEDHLMSLSKIRALENTVFLCVADQVGNHYVGCSVIYNPMGQSIASLEYDEGLMISDIDLGMVKTVRGTLPCLFQRRPHLYGNLN